MYQLFNVRFEIEFGGGFDVWRIFGNCPEHPTSRTGDIMPSRPVEFNPETNVFKTISGSTYEIVNYSMNKEKFIEEINECISRGSYSTH
jgi:hypothetical protein